MVCKKCGHIMSEQMSFCSRCGTVVGKENGNDQEMQPKDSIRMAFAPQQPKVVQTTPAEPIGFVKGLTPTVSSVNANTTTPATPAEEKKRSMLPIVLPVAGVAILVVGLAAVFGSRSGEAADKAPNNQKEWAAGVGKNSADSEDWSNDPTMYDEPAVTEAAVQKKMTIMVSDFFGPVADANVALLTKDGEEVRTVLSKQDGSAAMTMVDPGTYTLVISKKGYADLRESITLDDSTMAYDLMLQREMEHLYTTLTLRTKSYVDDTEISDVNVNVYAVRGQNPDDPYITTKSDEYGLCSLQNFPCGEFNIKCDAANFSPVIKGVEVSEENGQNLYTLYLMPVPAENEAYVVLDWNNADLDLDLCAYNDDMKEYVNTTHMSSQNGSFLYADQTGKAGVEAIVLKDVNTTALESIYVLDTTTALTGSRDSKMGESGVNVTIYKNGEEPIVYTMSGETNAPIWNVCNIKSGVVEKLNVNQYSTLLTDHLWAGDILGVKVPDPTPTTLTEE